MTLITKQDKKTEKMGDEKMSQKKDSISVLEGHHAFLCVGDGNVVRDYLAKEGVSAHALGVDYVEYTEPHLSITTARALYTASSTRPLSGRTIIVVYAKEIEREASHALLKLMEEPYGNTALILCVQDEKTIIPTLRSRLSLLYTAPVTHSLVMVESARAFRVSNTKERLETIKIYSEGERDDARAFVDALHEEYRALVRTDTSALRALLLARSYLSDRSSSVKQILEYLVGVLPTK